MSISFENSVLHAHDVRMDVDVAVDVGLDVDVDTYVCMYVCGGMAHSCMVIS